MWIIRLALNRPYTFVVAALLLLLVTPFVLIRTPTDVLPEINIPVVSIIWNFTGLSAKDIEQRMVYTEERVLTTTVNDIQHIESTSYDGIGIIKVFFQPTVTISTAVAQITAVSQTILRQLPPGTTPPLIIQYSASDVPVLQYGVGGNGISEQQAADIALNQLRVGLITVPGIAIPYPYGGKQRLVSIDLDLRKLQEKNLTQSDVTNAVNAQALVFPRAAISGVVREGVIAGALTALMILLFLGSWRSTVVVAISIPLSVLASLAVLSALGETINLMTLGGLALAVGILVDDATVTIENIERRLRDGGTLEDGIMAGAGEIAMPAFVSTLCICIVFVPMFFLTGVAKYLFLPLAEAVVFAMLASYFLSRTLVPTMVLYIMRGHEHRAATAKSIFGRLQRGFESGFEQFRKAYRELLDSTLERRELFAACFLAFCVLSSGLIFFLGQDFFPAVDAGVFRLH